MKTNIDEYVDNGTKNIYNIKSEAESAKKILGLSEEIVRNISKEKNEPDWVLDIRLKALDLYNKMEDPDWGPDISYLNIDELLTYVKPNTGENRSWEDVPDDIKEVFDKLGIPEDEKKSLAGVGAQFDSEMIYHNLTEKMKELGVIYTNFDVAIQEYPELVKESNNGTLSVDYAKLSIISFCICSLYNEPYHSLSSTNIQFVRLL